MVYILGWDHLFQSYEVGEHREGLKEIEFELRATFYSIAESLIRTNGIVFIGEECSAGQRTIARVLAEELSCKHAEIDMPSPEKERFGIAKDYQRCEDEAAHGYALREDYMIRRVYSESSETEERLIVCGFQHVRGLSERFRARGEEVTEQDLTKEVWFATACAKRLEMFSEL